MLEPGDLSRGSIPSPAQSGFGPGYLIGFLISFGAVIASFIMMFMAKGDVAVLRAVGLLVISFSGGFIFGVVYNIVTNKGFAWSSNVFGRVRYAELDRVKNPIGYWVFAAIQLLFFCMLIAGALWLRANADIVAPILRSPPPQ